jgi:uncharacterized protein
MSPSTRTPSLKGQVFTCLLFVALAVVITVAFHPNPWFSEWRVGLPVGAQLLAGGVFAAASFIGAAIVLHIPRVRRLVPVPEVLRNIDLSGAKPWVVGFCAGIGEEMLFRAALQPLLGIWLGAVIFAAAHVRTAMLGSKLTSKRIAYMLNVAIAGIALGLAFEHFGLLATILIHATIDVTGLLVYRSLSVDRSVQSMA